MPRELTSKQKTFCDEYLVDLNATRAAERAGYSKKTAQEQGSRLLSNVMVSAEIAVRRSAQRQRTEISADQVLRQLATIGFSDVGDFVEWTSDWIGLKPKEQICAPKLAVIESLAVADCEGKRSFRIKLSDRIRALELLGRHLGMFDGKSTPPKRSNEEVFKGISEALERMRLRIAARAEKKRVASDDD